MMKDISIFIAGATKETKDERECLKILANDLSYAKRADGIRINAMSYKNFNDNQERYNEFIENEADIVFIILKGGIGEKTKEEFVKAAESWREKKRPEVVVFLEENSFEENSYNAGEIRALMEVLLKQQYPVRYSTLEELRSAAKTRIEWYIDKISKQTELEQKDSKPKNQSVLTSTESSSGPSLNKENPDQNKVTSSFQKFFHFWQAWLLVALALLLGGLLLWFGLSRKSESVSEPTSNPILVFAGGGSVHQYLKENRGIDVDTFDNSIYLRMATSQSWTLLAEEVNHKNSSNNKFYPISISADEATEKDFIKACTKDEFREHARVVRYYLGEDTLVLYLTNDICDKYKLKKDILEKELFANLINNMQKDKIQILHTTPSSGTLRCWQKFMRNDDAREIEKDNVIYNEISDPNIIDNRDTFAILGSRYYYMQKWRQNNIQKKVISYDRDGQKIVSKPMYLYFVAEYYASEKDTITIARIPKEIMSFLKNVIPSNDPIWQNKRKWNPDEGYVIVDTGAVILHLNERPQKCY